MEAETSKRIGLTIGDAAGIGPELALRVAASWPARSNASLVLIGSDALLRRVGLAIGLNCPATITENELAQFCSGVAVLSIGALNVDAVKAGQWSAETGGASYQWVRWAIDAAQRKSIDAIVTGPIQKEAWHAAGIEFPGHTELLAAMTDTPECRMLLTSAEISCVLATTHLPLADVARSLTCKVVYRSIVLGHRALTHTLGRPARVTVCGLNPHAGEHGLFSHGEEERVIVPAVNQARAEGMHVVGPLSPDTAFVPSQRKVTDVYVCMYHDQGLIPLKALAFDDAVNVTLGLPIIRTSVDHGTAMDIAWRGVASDRSLRAAIEMAIHLA